MSTRSIHQFAEKVSLITDGGNPVGMSTALQLALNGSYVVVGMPNIQGRQPTSIAELESMGTLALSQEWEPDAMGGSGLVDAVREKFGRLDLLVNCLDVSGGIGFDKETAEGIDRRLDIELSSLIHLTRSAAELMAERPKPRIVNVVCEPDPKAPVDPVLAAVNNGVLGFTSSLAALLAGKFRVNAVSFRGGTHGTGGFDPELVRPRSIVDPDDVARAVLFLLSSESNAMNGKTLELG